MWQNTKRHKHKKTKHIVDNIQKDNIQIWQNTNATKTNMTKYKIDKIQMWQNIKMTKYKSDKMQNTKYKQCKTTI